MEMNMNVVGKELSKIIKRLECDKVGSEAYYLIRGIIDTKMVKCAALYADISRILSGKNSISKVALCKTMDADHDLCKTMVRWAFTKQEQAHIDYMTEYVDHCAFLMYGLAYKENPEVLDIETLQEFAQNLRNLLASSGYETNGVINLYVTDFKLRNRKEVF